MDFLSSKTMVTPAVSGGITTLITAALSTNFSLPGKWVALGSSFIFAIVIFFVDPKPPRWILRFAFLALNTCIVFAVAVGANSTGAAANRKPPRLPAPPEYESTPARPTKSFFHDWFSE